MRKIILPLLAGLLTLCANGQNNRRLFEQPMKVQSFTVKVEADQFIATTYIEIEFYNPNEIEEEGLYRFELKPGQAITAMQLDLHGKFRDGTIEEKGKATNAYNTIVGKRIDPALLHMDYYNQYSLRIYPLPPKGTRRISMTIQQVLKNEGHSLRYLLPLNIQDTVSRFSATVKVTNSQSVPVVTSGLLEGSRFELAGDSFKLSRQETFLRLNRELAFSIPISLQLPSVCTKNINGKTYFAIRYKQQVQKTYPVHPRTIDVYWDASITGINRDHKKEISFLRKYIATNNISRVQIITFNHEVLDTAVFYTGSNVNSRWPDYLGSLTYEGASQLGILDFSRVTSDAVFLFSDGRNSYGNDLPVTGSTKLYVIHASEVADINHILKMIGSTGGRHVDLHLIGQAQALQLSGEAENNLLEVRSADAGLVIDPGWSLSLENELFISGTVNNDETELILDFGNNGGIASRERIPIRRSNSCTNSSIERIPALLLFDSSIRKFDRKRLLDFGRVENIVTPNTSFIVLERIEDYIRYNIKPPKELEDQCDMNLFVTRKNKNEKQDNEQIEKDELAQVAHFYNERIRWFDKDQPAITISKTEKRETISSPVAVVSNAAPVVTALKNPPGDAKNSGFNSQIAMQEVVVTALGQTRQPKQLGYSVARVRDQELTQAKPVNLQNGLTGKVSGLQVQTVNPGVFGDTRITLRGIRSLTGNNQPMLLVDDMPVALGFINLINPNSIAEVTILKSAAATAIYGPDGANGALSLRTKKGSPVRGYYYNNRPYKLKDCEDMDYITEIKKVTRSDKMAVYYQLKKDYGYYAGFYFEMAQHLFEAGLKNEAQEILFSAAGATNGNMATIKAIAYTFESWKEMPQAIKVYSSILQADSNDLYAYRDLALAYYQAGRYQDAVNLYYKSITRGFEYHLWLIEWKATMLQEMNALIAQHKDEISLAGMNTQLIRPLPVDLRITVQSNKKEYGYGQISVLEPKKGNLNPYNRHPGRMPYEYQARNAGKGKYTIRANYYDSYWYDGIPGIPSFFKVVTFRKFGTAGQLVKVENILMDNQSGQVDITEITWE